MIEAINTFSHIPYLPFSFLVIFPYSKKSIGFARYSGSLLNPRDSKNDSILTPEKIMAPIKTWAPQKTISVLSIRSPRLTCCLLVEIMQREKPSSDHGVSFLATISCTLTRCIPALSDGRFAVLGIQSSALWTETGTTRDRNS